MQPLVRAEVTVLFADLAGFTAMTEKAEPEQVAELLGTFFTKAADAIFAEGGTLDKFIGDCVMAFFGAPVGRSAACAARGQCRVAACSTRWTRGTRSAVRPSRS
jgi:class 3 adenylate cyclase